MAKKKSNLTAFIIIIIALGVLTSSPFSIFGSQDLIFNDNINFQNINFAVKSDVVYGSTDEPGCQPNSDENCWNVKTSNSVSGNSLLDMDQVSQVVDRGGGGGNAGYLGIRTMIKSVGLNIPIQSIDKIEIDFSSKGSISDCASQNAAEVGSSFQVLLVNENNVDKLIHSGIGITSITQPSATQDGILIIDRLGDNSFSIEFTGTSNPVVVLSETININNGNYELLFFNNIPASKCGGEPGSTSSNRNLKIRSIKIDGVLASSGMFDVDEEILDEDGDGIEDSLDNCIDLPNPEQEDSDGNGIGDACQENEESDPFPTEKPAFLIIGFILLAVLFIFSIFRFNLFENKR